ncbi:MAG: DUF4760 domain-containing protein [Pirellulales bacterium]
MSTNGASPKHWDKFSAVSSFVQAVVVTATLGALVWQVSFDQRQRRLESTLSFVIDASREYRAHDVELCGRDTNGNVVQLTDERVAEIMLDDRLMLKASNLLAEFEWMASGVQSGVLDIEMVNTMRGTYLVSFYKRWYPYIQERIRLTSAERRTTLYEQLEWLAFELANKRSFPGDLMPKRLKRDFADHEIARRN